MKNVLILLLSLMIVSVLGCKKDESVTFKECEVNETGTVIISNWQNENFTLSVDGVFKKTLTYGDKITFTHKKGSCIIKLKQTNYLFFPTEIDRTIQVIQCDTVVYHSV